MSKFTFWEVGTPKEFKKKELLMSQAPNFQGGYDGERDGVSPLSLPCCIFTLVAQGQFASLLLGNGYSKTACASLLLGNGYSKTTW